jgi:hypothetical protein
MSVERLEKGDEINDRWILCHPQDIVVNGRSLKVKHAWQSHYFGIRPKLLTLRNSISNRSEG